MLHDNDCIVVHASTRRGAGVGLEPLLVGVRRWLYFGVPTERELSGGRDLTAQIAAQKLEPVLVGNGGSYPSLPARDQSTTAIYGLCRCRHCRVYYYWALVQDKQGYVGEDGKYHPPRWQLREMLIRGMHHLL